MPYETQMGDLATRIRRALRVVGRITTKLDEMVVPVAPLINLDQDPFRDEPNSFMAYGEFAGVIPLPDFLLLGIQATASVVVVRKAWMYGSNQQADIFLGRQTAGTRTTFANCISVNRTGGTTAAQYSRAAALAIAEQAAAGLGAPYVRIGHERWTIFGHGAEFNVPIVLFPGDELILQQSSGADPNNFEAWFHGEEYSQL